jgi:hypothetical protein
MNNNIFLFYNPFRFFVYFINMSQLTKLTYLKSILLNRCLGVQSNFISRNLASNEGEKCNEPTKKKKKTPKGRFDDDFDEAPKSYNEKEPLPVHPGGVNPSTGEQGGPRGPEPTRYGDWERKGRVSDF